MLEAAGNLGELIAAIATVATLFYLALQIRQSAAASQAACQQALLDTFYETGAALSRDPELARLVGTGLAGFESLSDRDKTLFNLVLSRFVGNLEKGLRLRAGGMIDDETLDGVATGMVSCLRTPGGQQWWQVVRGTASRDIVEYLESRASNPEEPRWNEMFPFWFRWGTEALPSEGPGDGRIDDRS